MLCETDQNCSDYSAGTCIDDFPNDLNYRNECDAAASCTDASDCIACVKSDDKNAYGFAKIISLGDSGWIRLDDDDGSTAPSYGISLASDRQFEGWAWNGNSETYLGAGWVSTNCENRSCSAGANQGNFCDDDSDCPGGACTDYCTASDHRIYLSMAVPSGVTVIPISSQRCSALSVSWTYPSEENYRYNVYRDNALIGTTNLGITSYPDLGLTSNTNFSYEVSAIDALDIESARSSPAVTGTTDTVCEIANTASITRPESNCPGSVTLDWEDFTGTCTFDYYELARCQCDSLANCIRCDTTPDSANLYNYELFNDGSEGACYRPGDSSNDINDSECIDDHFDSTLLHESNKRYKYSIRVHCSTPDADSAWTSPGFPSDGVVPCKRPQWIERKTN